MQQALRQLAQTRAPATSAPTPAPTSGTPTSGTPTPPPTALVPTNTPSRSTGSLLSEAWGGFRIYRLPSLQRPSGIDARGWYRDHCMSYGLRPVVCDDGTHQYDYSDGVDAVRDFNAVALPQVPFSCDLSPFIESNTDWTDTVTFYQANMPPNRGLRRDTGYGSQGITACNWPTCGGSFTETVHPLCTNPL